MVQGGPATDGYARRHGLPPQRQLTLSADGRELRARRDVLLNMAAAAGPGGELRDPLPPRPRGLEAGDDGGRPGRFAGVRGATVWQFRCRGGALSIEDSLWLDGEARPHAGLQLVISGESPPDGHTIAWIFRRAG